MADLDDGFIIGARSTSFNHKQIAEKENLEIEKIFDAQYFNDTFLNIEKFNHQKLMAKNSQLGQTKNRLNFWRAFLGLIFIGDEEKTRKQLKESRDFYNQEKEKFKGSKDPKQDNPLMANPLAKNTNNPWNTFFENSELRNTIKTDVERTYQDREFFQKQSIKDILTNVLFVWCKQNPGLSYKQGMNEVIGIITHVYFTESQETDNKDYFSYINSQEFAEADIYAIYNKIMDIGQMEMFRYDKKTATTQDLQKIVFTKYASNLPADVLHNFNYFYLKIRQPQLKNQMGDHPTKQTASDGALGTY